MATPMSWRGILEFMCCQCFEGTPNEHATFDVDTMTLVDVCPGCRMMETYWMIRKFASYDDNPTS